MFHPLTPRSTRNDAIRPAARVTAHYPLREGGGAYCSATLRGIIVAHNEAAGGLAKSTTSRVLFTLWIAIFRAVTRLVTKFPRMRPGISGGACSRKYLYGA